MVIADDTIGSALNLNVLNYADLIFSSLTKTFSGSGAVLAGSLVVSPASAWRHPLHFLLQEPVATLADPDMLVLARDSRDVHQRVTTQDANSLRLAEHLRAHPQVAQVAASERLPELCRNP